MQAQCPGSSSPESALGVKGGIHILWLSERCATPPCRYAQPSKLAGRHLPQDGGLEKEANWLGGRKDVKQGG
eukprot:scaffold10764_cov159-Ochromonas_danica.AAC.34